MTSPSDPAVIIAGIRRFGLAPDGADLRDLEAAIARLRAPATDVGDTTSIADRMEHADAIGMRFPDMRDWHYLTRDERSLIIKRLRSSPVNDALRAVQQWDALYDALPDALAQQVAEALKDKP